MVSYPVGVSNTVRDINVKDPVYGAVGDGVADDTAAFQAAINACTGSAAPASNTRTPVAPLYIPPGTYKITSDLKITSVSGFRFTGAGIAETTLNASGGGFTQAVILIDGSLDGIFEGFALQGDGTEQVTDGIRLDKTAAALRTTTANRFRDIRVRALKFVNGISLQGNASVQIDGTVFDNVVVTGGQTAGSWLNTGNWQTGFLFGNGTYGNNYDHVATGSSAALCYYSMKVNASSIDLDGSQPAGNFADFWILTNGQTSLKNIQSQGSGQLIDTPASSSPQVTTVSDVLFTTTAPNAAYPIAKLLGGMWVFSNISATNIFGAGAYQTGVFTITGTNSVRACVATFDNVTVQGARSAAFVLSNADVLLRNFHNYTVATGNFVTPAAGELLSLYTNGAWLNVDQSVVTPQAVTWVTAAGTTTYTIPTGATTIEVTLQGAGGGGGAGALVAAGAAGGGGGGNAGGHSFKVFNAADLGASVSLTVGTAGSGAPAVSVAGSGTAGSAGTASTFGTVLNAGGGGGGNGGTNVAGGTASAVVGIGSQQWGSTAGAGSAAGAGAAGIAPLTGGNGASGGGGGGGTTGAASSNGGATQIPIIGATGNTGSGGVAGGANPGSGTQPTVKGIPSCGGGGGASTFGAATTSQSGATAFNGGGGGGGGGNSAGTASGAGGTGGGGFALIIAKFT